MVLVRFKNVHDTEMLNCIASRLWNQTVRSVECHKTANTSKTSRGQKGVCSLCAHLTCMFIAERIGKLQVCVWGGGVVMLPCVSCI